MPNTEFVFIGYGPSVDKMKDIPNMNSDYSEYLVKVLGDDFSTDMWEWITGLTGMCGWIWISSTHAVLSA